MKRNECVCVCNARYLNVQENLVSCGEIPGNGRNKFKVLSMRGSFLIIDSGNEIERESDYMGFKILVGESWSKSFYIIFS